MKKYLLLALFAVSGSVQAAPASGCYSGTTHTAPDSRFSDHGNGTVTDRATGLMWKQCREGLSTVTTPCDTGAATLLTWQAALQEVETINGGSGFAGYSDWRMPNRNELQSLVERACYGPAVNETYFPGVEGPTWSASPVAGIPGSAWVVGFDGGGDARDSMTGNYGLLLVRDR